jgi:hypothetical protein
MLVVVKNLRTVGSLVRALRVTSITNPARPPPTSTWPSYLPYSESLMRNFNVEVTRWQGKYERGPTGTDHWQPRSWLQPTPHKTRACCLPGRARAGRPSRAGRRTNAPPRRTGCRLPRQVSRKSGPESIFFDFFSKFDHPVLHPGREGRAQSSSKFHPQFFFPEGALATCERSPCREARDGSLCHWQWSES